MTPIDKSLVNNVMTHDAAEMLRLRRAQWAKEAGLPVDEFARPFPTNTTSITVNQEIPKPTLGWKGIALAGLLLGTGLISAGAVPLVQWLTKDSPQATPAASPPADDHYEFSVDGGKTWKPVEVQR
jgi:hypothetical protein